MRKGWALLGQGAPVMYETLWEERRDPPLHSSPHPHLHGDIPVLAFLPPWPPHK